MKLVVGPLGDLSVIYIKDEQIQLDGPNWSPSVFIFYKESLLEQSHAYLFKYFLSTI